jgi:pimeloyl-ACP methyl ester carboxylesterase
MRVEYARGPMLSPRPSAHRRRAVAVLLVGVLLVGCSPTPVPSPTSSSVVVPSASPVASAEPTPVPTFPPTPPAAWRDCGKGFQCATIQLPRDYVDTTKGVLSVALIRRPAEHQADRIGSLVINPGGPGGSGIEFVRSGAASLPKAIREQFDIVGFDPRGVDASSPVRCVEGRDLLTDLDPSPDSTKEINALVAQAQDYADECARLNADLLPYLSTSAVVDDLDRIRHAVGDDKLTYLGFSYGTLIGSMYADRYPDHIRAMVLDGAIDPNLDEVQLRTGQAKAFEAALGRFFKWCSSHKSCYFYEGGNTRKAFDSLMAKIDKKPIPILRFAGRRKLGPGLAFAAVLGAMYSRDSWPVLGLALYAAKKGDGRYLVAISDPFRGRKSDGSYSNAGDAYFSVTCLDFPSPTKTADYKKLSEQLRKAAPRFRAVAFNDLPCAFWPEAPQRVPAPATGAGAPPIVVVGSTGDPATPYAWAKSLAKQLESATLVTRKGEGHTGYFASKCVGKALDAYLLKLTVPKAGLTCAK